jgi:hypothetical protein
MNNLFTFIILKIRLKIQEVQSKYNNEEILSKLLTSFLEFLSYFVDERVIRSLSSNEC